MNCAKAREAEIHAWVQAPSSMAARLGVVRADGNQVTLSLDTEQSVTAMALDLSHKRLGQ